MNQFNPSHSTLNLKSLIDPSSFIDSSINQASSEYFLRQSHSQSRIKDHQNITLTQDHLNLIKRVPFSQILNQQQQDSPQKLSHKIIDAESSHAKSGQQLDKVINTQKNITQSKLNKKTSFQTKGTKSIQLISIVQKKIEHDPSISPKNPRNNSKPYNQTSNFSPEPSQEQKRYKLVINQQALEELINLSSNQTLSNQSEPKHNQKFVICTIVGKTKTGKSFLLNQLINSFSQNSQNLSLSEPSEFLSLNQAQYQSIQSLPTPTNAFTVNHTLAPCTKGLWLSQQKISFTSNGQSVNLILLDTQGLGSYESTQQLDYKLLILSLLLTDLLCFNSIGPIDEQMINGMSLAVQVSKLIHKTQDKSNLSTKQTIPKTLPSLLWILRDFSLQLMTKDNQQISEDQYLENCLSLQTKIDKASKNNQKQPSNNKSQAKNEKSKSKENMRKSIKQIFRNRKCSTLVMPFDEQGTLRPQFKQGLQGLKSKFKGLIDESKDESKNGKNKIEDFVCGLKAYVQVLNNQDPTNGHGLFPKIQLLQENLTKTKVQFQLEKLSQTYDSLFSKYQYTLQNLQSEIQCRETYLSKMNALKDALQLQAASINDYFNQSIILKFNGKTNQNPTNQSGSEGINQKNEKSLKVNFKKILANGAGSKLIENIQRNYEEHLNSVRQRKNLIVDKIDSKIQSLTNRSHPCPNRQTNRSHPCSNKQKQFNKFVLQANIIKTQYQTENLLSRISNQTNEWVQIMKSISKISELKKAYEKGFREVQNIRIDRKEMNQDSAQSIQNQKRSCLKELQVEYLRQKVNLMQQSHYGHSNTSFNSHSKSNHTFNSNYSQFKQGNSQHYQFDSIHQQGKQVNQQAKQVNQQGKQVRRFDDCSNCQKSFYVPYIIIPSPKFLKLKFVKTIFKEVPQDFSEYAMNQCDSGISQFRNQADSLMDKKLKAEFIIEVGLNDRNWLIRRKLKDFIELNKIVILMFNGQLNYQSPQNQQLLNNYTNIQLQTLQINSSQMVVSSQECGKNLKIELERFLNYLNGRDQIRNSRIFQKFVKINKEYLDL